MEKLVQFQDFFIKELFSMHLHIEYSQGLSFVSIHFHTGARKKALENKVSKWKDFISKDFLFLELISAKVQDLISKNFFQRTFLMLPVESARNKIFGLWLKLPKRLSYKLNKI